MSQRNLTDVLAQQRAEERVRALRALLMRPLLSAQDEEFALVRRHVEELGAFLMRETGWFLIAEQGCVRLLKRPADLSDATRGAPGFDRRRYVLLCLACAVLERAESQITLRQLGEELMRLASDPELTRAHFQFGLDQAHERRDLVNVCRFLVDYGVLARVAGDEEAFVSQAAARTGDALYDIRRRLLAHLLACARGPSTFPVEQAPSNLDARLLALTDEGVPSETEDARRSARRHALARRLLDDPVVYVDQLDAEEREYFSNQRGPLCARLAEATDLISEQRAEGSALVDPDGELSDARLPAEGTVAHATLLLAEYLAGELRKDPTRFVAEAEIARFMRSAADSYGRYWRKAEREPGAETALAREALAQLVRLGLVSVRDGAAKARPALARYAVAQPMVQPTRQLSLV
jgi:uncharacterized protein (TIGR02678 family)